MTFLQGIYDSAPVPVQNLMATIAGYKRNRHRYGEVYWQHRKWLEHFDSLSYTEKMKFQNTELKRFILESAQRSEFYRGLYNGIDLQRIGGPQDLRVLPIVDKEDLRERISDVYTVSAKESSESQTGGTTGKSLVVRVTPEDSMKRKAVLDHFKARVGFEHREMRRATFMGKHIVPGDSKKTFWRYNHACKQMLYSSFHLNDENMLQYVNSLNKFRPQAIDGFFSCMVDIAKYIERENLTLEFKPIALFPTAETVTEHGRNLLERIFGCPVYNQYASSEGAPFITECSEGTLHVEHSTGIFEVISASTNEVVVTSFSTHGTPLIRYKIGDSIEFSNRQSCGCGNESMLVNSIEGRTEEYLYTSSGARINSGVVANIFKNIPNAIVKAQVVQESMNDILMLIEVDNDRYLPQHDDEITDEFYRVFGKGTQLSIRHVSSIPREKSGKHRFIKNSIEPSM